MKFTIRDLFLVTAIVALAVGWGIDRTRLAREIRCLKKPVDPYYTMGPAPDFLRKPLREGRLKSIGN